ncbi:MAG: hypothetical protein WCT14_06665 [Treponemataceae bacterium]
MENRKRLGWAFAVVLAFVSHPFSAFAQKVAPNAPKVENRAILDRGSESIKGLPNFGRNSFPALYGEYRLERVAGVTLEVPGEAGGPPKVRVWITSEALFISAAAWTARRLVGRSAYSAASTPGSEGARERLYLFDRPFVAEGQGAVPKLWSVLVAIPDEAGANAAYERFISPFLDKLSYFLSNARGPTDVSFPAIVEW